MPYLSVQTNVTVADKAGLMATLSAQVAGMLGKPESYVMVHVQGDAAMMFAGHDEPAAYAQLKSLGLPESQTETYSAKLCHLLQAELGIAPDRIYIEFSAPERHMWGWNNGTF